MVSSWSTTVVTLLADRVLPLSSLKQNETKRNVLARRVGIGQDSVTIQLERIGRRRAKEMAHQRLLLLLISMLLCMLLTSQLCNSSALVLTSDALLPCKCTLSLGPPVGGISLSFTHSHARALFEPNVKRSAHRQLRLYTERI